MGSEGRDVGEVDERWKRRARSPGWREASGGRHARGAELGKGKRGEGAERQTRLLSGEQGR
eukprot:1766026-Rhodomonas_salina.1